VQATCRRWSTLRVKSGGAITIWAETKPPALRPDRSFIGAGSAASEMHVRAVALVSVRRWQAQRSGGGVSAIHGTAPCLDKHVFDHFAASE